MSYYRPTDFDLSGRSGRQELCPMAYAFWNKLKKVFGAPRIKHGCKSSTNFSIIDAQNVKNTDSARQKSYDTGNKGRHQASHRRRYARFATHRCCHTAKPMERKGALLTLGRCRTDLSTMQRILANGKYQGLPFAQEIEAFLRAKVEIAKRSELYNPVMRDRRALFLQTGKMPAVMEKLRAKPQHQLAIYPFSF